CFPFTALPPRGDAAAGSLNERSFNLLRKEYRRLTRGKSNAPWGRWVCRLCQTQLDTADGPFALVLSSGTAGSAAHRLAACAPRREGTQDLKCGTNDLRWDGWLLVPDRVQVIPHERNVLFSQEPQDGKPCGDIVNHP